MNTKGIGLMALMVAMSLSMNAPSQRRTIVVDDPRQRNNRKKCFRKDCENLRTGNKLYCSAECCKLDKKKSR